MVLWKRNLVVVWVSQFLSIAGFTFALPFAPYYMQELGVTDPVELKLWVSLFAAAAPLSLAVCAPIWGALADRFGRRLMLLRANFGAAVVLTSMGLVNGVGMLLLLRLLQGVLTGTVTAAQTLVSTSAPPARSGFALGVLNSGVFSGVMIGVFCGGLFAEAYGYRRAFFMAGGMLLLAGLLVAFGTVESFHRPPPTERAQRGVRARLAALWPILPVLGLIGAAAFVRSFDMPFVPLLVQDIHGGIDGAARWTGGLFAVGGMAGFLAGIACGHLADRMSPVRISGFSALCAGVLMLPQGLLESFLPLFVLRFGTTFCVGGLEPVFQAWISKTTPEEKRGVIFGWGATARAAGWMLAPLASGLVATAFGVRSVFFAASACFFILAPVIVYIIRRQETAAPRPAAGSE